MGVAKSDFSQMRQSRSDLIKNAERFTGIDLDLSDKFEKERNQYWEIQCLCACHHLNIGRTLLIDYVNETYIMLMLC